MSNNSKLQRTPAPETGRVSFLDGQGELPVVEIETPWSKAEVYLLGAHVTRFKRHQEPPLLFMSQCSRYTDGQPIRGGIPIIFPWFGPREGMGQHGYVRNRTWSLKEFRPAADGTVSLRFQLPDCPEANTMPAHSVEYVVTVNQELTLQLIVTNLSSSDPIVFENCLHTYLDVGDASTISIQGLKGVEYLDKVANFAQKTETNDVIRIASEVDRVYHNTTGPVEIIDPRLGRKITVSKEGSASTVVWNPWINKSQQMPDFGNDEYQRMVCVESGNVGANQVTLPPGQTSTLTVHLHSVPLA